MPKRSVHEAISKIRTEKKYSELHSWLDEGVEDEGVNHRSKNHFYTEEIRKFVFEKFGGAEAVSEWLLHIALDNLDTATKNDHLNKLSSSNFYKFGFGDDGFIYYDELDIGESGLLSEFSNYDLEETK